MNWIAFFAALLTVLVLQVCSCSNKTSCRYDHNDAGCCKAVCRTGLSVRRELLCPCGIDEANEFAYRGKVARR